MTFGTAENVNSANESLSLKLSYGDEIRRATYNNVPFDGLRDLVAKLFGLESASIVLKYQDDDGDKITMSSDGELQEAVRAVKQKQLLRLFVDVKQQPAPAPTPEVQEPAREGHQGFPWMGQGFPRGPHAFGPHYGPHHRGAFGHHGPHHGPYHGPHHGPGPHHGGPHHGHGPHHGGPHPHHARPGFPPGGRHLMMPVNPELVQVGERSKDEMFKLLKERKCAMKQQLKLMKANATTPEDVRAFKELKKQFRVECKQAKWQARQAYHAEKKCKKNKCDRFIAKHVADVTIPDNSELPADTPVTKTWRLRNAGMNAWPADSQLIFISRLGDNLNGPEKVNVGAVAPQEEVEVSVSFITPSHPGRYVAYYRMATNDGNKFGQRVWVSFVIPSSSSSTTTTSTTPSALVDVAMD